MNNIRKLVRELIRESMVSEREVSAYHGSPYEFEKFTTAKMGTGEGAQAFGWGLYFTDLEDIAKGYAEKSYDKSKLEYINKRISELSKELDKYSSGEYGKYNNPIGYELKKEYDNLINRRQEEIRKGRSVYKVSLHKGKSPEQYTWLDWDKPISEKNLIKIFNGAEKVGGIDFKDGWELDSEYGLTNQGGYKVKGEEMYRWLSKKLNGDKQASLFLLDVGIDGIKYPAESISRGATSDVARGYNYVVFDENAISIEKVDKI